MCSSFKPKLFNPGVVVPRQTLSAYFFVALHLCLYPSVVFSPQADAQINIREANTIELGSNAIYALWWLCHHLQQSIFCEITSFFCYITDLKCLASEHLHLGPRFIEHFIRKPLESWRDSYFKSIPRKTLSGIFSVHLHLCIL